jgi:hypothetical protein
VSDEVRKLRRHVPDRVVDRSLLSNPSGGFALGAQRVVDPKLISARNPYGVPSVAELLRRVDDASREAEDRIATMRALWEQGADARDIAREFGIDASSVRAIAKNRRWHRK